MPTRALSLATIIGSDGALNLADVAGLHTVAGTGSYTDLINKPTIPSSALTFTGDASGSGTTGTTTSLTLANSGVSAGSYGSATNIPAITVDSKGRITSVTNTAVSIPSGSLTFTGDVTGSGTTGSSTSLTLASVGTAGTYTKVTTDAKGRVTSGTTLASSDLPTYTGTISSSQVTTALGFTPYNSTNPSGYLTTESDTLATVTGRGASTSTNITLSGGTLSLTAPANAAANLYMSGDNVFRWIAGTTGYGVGSGFGLYSDSLGAYYMSLSTAGNWYFGSNNHNSSYRVSINGTGYATGDFRAPIFYDSNDTNFYLDSNGSSNLNRVTSQVTVLGTKRSYYIGNITASGTQARRFEIARVYIDYNDWHMAGVIQVELHNYYFTGGDYQLWNISYDYNNVNCTLIAGDSPRGRYADVKCSSPVQISGDNYYISIYVDVKYYAYYYAYIHTSWPETTTHGAQSGYILIYNTTSTAAITNISDFTPSSTIATTNTIQSSNSLSAPIFYDIDDTGYYVNPRLTSRLSGLRLDGVDNEASGADAILWINKPNNNDWAMIVSGNLEYGLDLRMAASHSYAIRATANGTEYSRLGSDLFYHNSHIRAPIFYDSDNTGYYADLSSTGDSIRAAGNIIAYYSDDRLKTKLGNITDALKKVNQLNGFYYQANELAQNLGYKPTMEVGVSAQEVEQVLPQIVKPAPIDQQYKTVDYSRLVPLLIEAVKELSQKLSKLEAKYGITS